MAMERYELHGVRVYQLDICAAIDDHHLCPGITSLHAGDFELERSPAIAPATESLRTKFRSDQSASGVIQHSGDTLELYLQWLFAQSFSAKRWLCRGRYFGTTAILPAKKSGRL
jgi:hypothetical protein